MSTGVHSYSPDFASLGGQHLPSQSPTGLQHGRPLTGLDALAAGSQYALQQMRNNDYQNGQQYDLNVQPGHGHLPGQEEVHKARTESVSSQQKPGKAGNGPVRRRISRACDQCNQLRTKCDGKFPCAHCVEFGLTCEYARERKKRGKASRKELAAQQAAAAAASGASSAEVDQGSPQSSRSGSDRQRPPTSEIPSSAAKRRRSSMNGTGRPAPPVRTQSAATQPAGEASFIVPQHRNAATNAVMSNDNAAAGMPDAAATPMPGQQFTNGQALSVSNMNSHNMVNHRLPFGVDFQPMDEYQRNAMHNTPAMNGQQNVLHSNVLQTPGAPIQQYGQNPYTVPSPQSQHGGGLNNQFRIGDSPMSGGGNLMGNSPHGGSPAWLDLPSPSASIYAHLQQSQTQQSLRYPVLKPLLPRISSIIPVSLACDLLDMYFATTSMAFVQPASPYILGFVLRKRSVLRKQDPRPCSRALLASMLWVAAQTSESSFLTSPPSQRGKICHQLLELTISLLRPLVHTPTHDTSGAYSAHSVINGVALGGFGVANPAAGHDTEGGSTGAAAALDDVITYINLATVVSASEYKAASLRWWNAAWSLARELKLGRELPPNPPRHNHQDDMDTTTRVDNDMNAKHQGQGQAQRPFHPNMPQPGVVGEEEREERRRIWWLLYIVDRHLALCYNRPLFLLDVECDGLLQPENDTVWQQGDFYPPENYEQSLYFRRRGPCFECTGHSIFGYFLPLMTILGEIVDISHAKNHPRFGMRFRTGHEWDEQINEISQQLEAYGRSLKDFEARFIPPQDGIDKQFQGDPHHDHNSPSVQSTSTGTARMTEAVLQTRIVVAYGTHLMHTLYIALNGKWDPISLLDDNDLWISSQSFISATGHAVSAAEAISDILEYDPDLSFMPFFFGIYLLQGSFLLLLIADKLQGEASPSVVKACETIVRAHEVCVVTLNTEYQRNFRKVMRSALAQVKGRMPEDFGEQQQRRREVLALYRWTGDGTGLAL
ncbi:fungal-specific transcription factor domain-containing protein [Elsinoe ampelina]|uniref:Fungal-specific transcription factor domain-containing protein n=1 Tax=Elsinoe ampelina TaxID=302913 RepID=A0A6A6GMI3_9PEZI|nr:fungal-specific transcription factor domain-containing protein [Elsinoe ampelina]